MKADLSVLRRTETLIPGNEQHTLSVQQLLQPHQGRDREVLQTVHQVEVSL